METRWMRKDERSEVAAFINGAMRRAYGCDAYPLPAMVFVAHEMGRRVGAIALSVPENGRLPIEKIYDIDERSFPGGVRPAAEQMIQFGRWVGTAPEVSQHLLLAAASYALHNKYVWAVSEIMPHVRRRLLGMGVAVRTIAATVHRSSIPLEVLPYYDEPDPFPCMVLLAELQRALSGIRG